MNSQKKVKILTSGIIVVDKEAGASSAQVIAKVKYKLNLKKIGHAGTLDPMATGLLVCLTNSSTRLAQYAEAGGKVYTGTIQFGLTTSTDDITGDIIEDKRDSFDIDTYGFGDIVKNIERFTGVIEQVPPQTSAIKVDGKRAYQLQREGKEFELKKRNVTITKYTIEQISKTEISFEVHCSKGTYIRSLARDLGEILGCGGCLSSLRRVSSYPFEIKEAKRIENISVEDIICWSKLFPETHKLELNESQIGFLQNGKSEILAGMKEQLPKDDKKALYVDSLTKKPYGLLLRESEQWKIGVNIACQA